MRFNVIVGLIASVLFIGCPSRSRTQTQTVISNGDGTRTATLRINECLQDLGFSELLGIQVFVQDESLIPSARLWAQNSSAATFYTQQQSPMLNDAIEGFQWILEVGPESPQDVVSDIYFRIQLLTEGQRQNVTVYFLGVDAQYGFDAVSRGFPFRNL